ncbi:phenoloxidase-activating factor 1-like [Osmia lignaria lignaria]|uniref:phenoloxidase-activating factor 1-like n=1 Tax=Osmia lignaria lignaria TaxID=1437193 RepID=UPI00402B18E5
MPPNVSPQTHTSSNKIINANRSVRENRRWTKGESAACGGSVINHRYVLTAAHCLKGTIIPVGWKLAKVRLGEYDTRTNPDCIKNGANSEICADDAITAGIEKQIAHENYRPPSRDQKYDIALLRLDRDIPFTDYIKPICLPPNDAIGTKLVVAGWGRTNNAPSSNIKMKVSVPLADKQQCERRYSRAGVTLGFGQICAGGVEGEDSCSGDSGGPLMSEEKGSDGIGRWTAVGLVSFGPTPCGFRNWPAVYTRVIDFIPWILSKLEP